MIRVILSTVVGLFISANVFATEEGSPLSLNPRTSAAININSLMVEETDSSVIISIDGYEVQSPEQIYDTIASGFKLPLGSIKNLQDLGSLLKNPKSYGDKEIQINFTSGSFLKLNISVDYVDDLITVLNEVNAFKNRSESLKSRLQIQFWQ